MGLDSLLAENRMSKSKVFTIKVNVANLQIGDWCGDELGFVLDEPNLENNMVRVEFTSGVYLLYPEAELEIMRKDEDESNE